MGASFFPVISFRWYYAHGIIIIQNVNAPQQFRTGDLHDIHMVKENISKSWLIQILLFFLWEVLQGIPNVLLSLLFFAMISIFIYYPSASYFAYSFTEKDLRRVEFIPLTGHPYMDRYSIPSSSQEEAFRTQITRRINGRHSNRFIRIVAVYGAPTPKTLLQFQKALGQAVSTAFSINIVSKEKEDQQFPGKNTKIVPVTTILDQGILAEEYISLAIYNPYWLWEQDIFEKQDNYLLNYERRKMVSMLQKNTQDNEAESSSY